MLRSRTAKWFQTKIRYDKTMEDGLQKKVAEPYVVDALSFSEAEARITGEMKKYISGEFEVRNIDPTPFSEIFFSDSDKDDKFFKAKLIFITINEKTGKEQRSTIYYLVQAGTLETARKYITEVMGQSMADYEISSITETPIMDVYEYKAADEG